ncbi:MAG TPA: hypothetical protein VJZ93_02380 [Candidatus Nanoarchaeia archaeon]|nr:hypothetical protein [Candidatus Nanoarchaeia archaeon]
MEGLYEIDSNSKGLRGFVGNLGKSLEKTLKNEFKDRVEDYKIEVEFGSGNTGGYYALQWGFNGNQYSFRGEFSIEQSDEERDDLVIDYFRGVRINELRNYAAPRASVEELTIAADMEKSVIRFLEKNFGDSTGERGNGCPIYEIKLPSEYVPLEKSA